MRLKNEALLDPVIVVPEIAADAVIVVPDIVPTVIFGVPLNPADVPVILDEVSAIVPAEFGKVTVGLPEN